MSDTTYYSPITSVSKTIHDVYYENITPKIIRSRDVYETASLERLSNIAPGINCIDIDWNSFSIGDNKITHTSDLVKLLNKMYVETGDDSDYWEDITFTDEPEQSSTFNLRKPNANELYTMMYRYVDADYNVLDTPSFEEFTEVQLYTLIDENMSPYTASYIEKYKVFADSTEEHIEYMPLDNAYAALQIFFGNRSYRVGLFSDIHHDDTCVYEAKDHVSTHEGNEYNVYEDLQYALNKFRSYDDVDFICIAGDIATSTNKQLHSFIEYCLNNSELPIFACKGNTDNYVMYSVGTEEYNNDWITSIEALKRNANVQSFQYFTTGDKTSFYFERDNDIYIMLNVDYGIATSCAFKSLDDSITNYMYYNQDTIVELQSILDKYRNNRCFVFTHLPFVQKAGNPAYDFSKQRSLRHMLSGVQFALLNELNNYYTNTIWFSGHTHYQWKWQTESDRANVCNYDVLNDDYNYNDYADYGQNVNDKYPTSCLNKKDYIKSAYNVHIPSLSKPLRIGEFETYNESIVNPGAEAAVMDVYESGVNIRGIVFADVDTNNAEYKNMYSSVANYWLPVPKTPETPIESKTFEYFETKIEQFNR